MVPAALLAAALSAAPPRPDARLYELRTYTAHPGRLDALVARFRDAAVPLFGKHGLAGVGYWLPDPNPDNRFVALMVHRDRAARDAAFKAFAADPDWRRATAESDAAGKVVAKVEERFLACTDYSPAVEVTAAGPPRVFELRLYQSSPNNLAALNARFRDHTTKLFAKHGMTNLWYWNPAAGDVGPGADLVYLLAHRSAEAKKAAWDAFRADPAWLAARTASEEKAGGVLTAKDGVKSITLKPTEFSPLK